MLSILETRALGVCDLRPEARCLVVGVVASRTSSLLTKRAGRLGFGMRARRVSSSSVVPVRHFVKYTFLTVDPAWRRLDDERRAEDKREFIAACEDFADGHLLRTFSLVGTRGDADLMLLSQAQNLERIHEFHVVLAQSGLMKWCSIPYSFLAMTKPSEYSDESRLEVRPGQGQVPVRLSVRQDARVVRAARRRALADHAGPHQGRPRVPVGRLNTSYSFGLDDQEFVVAFETDNPADFLDLVQRLRTTESSSYTLRDTPTFTCIACSVERALGALDGAALTVTAPGA